MKNIKFLIIIVILLSLMSCFEFTGGLFYGLEEESEINNGSLDDSITIGAMEKNADYYFVAAGKFMYRAIDSDINLDWTAKNPDDYSSYLCHNMEIVGSTIYAIFYSTDSKMFSADVSTPAAGITWTEFSLTEISSDETVIDITYSGSKVFIYTSYINSGGYTRYAMYATDSATFTAGSLLTPISSDISVCGVMKVDYDAVSTNYWIACGNKLLTYDGVTTVVDLTSAAKAASSKILGNGFSGVLCADTDTTAGTEVYVTTEEGVILKHSGSDNTTGWTTMVSSEDEDDGVLFDHLYDLAHIKIESEDIDIIIAASASGYYEMEAAQDAEDKAFINPESSDSNLTQIVQFSSIDLSDSVISGFFFDDRDKFERVFALGYNSGLWRNSVVSGTRDWDIE